MPLETSELTRLADRNLAHRLRDETRFHPSGQLFEYDGILRAVSATRFPGGAFNCALLMEPLHGEAATIFDGLTQFYAERDRGFTVQLCGERNPLIEQECLKRSLLKGGENPGMVLDAPLPTTPLPQGVQVEVARSPDTMRAVHEVETRGYARIGLPAQAAEKLFAHPERWLEPHWHHVLVSYQGEPASAAMVMLSHGIAGVYWVATTPEARGRGLAEIATRTVSNWAFSMSARAVILQASVEGEPVYRRMGFRTFSRYPWYVSPKP